MRHSISSIIFGIFGIQHIECVWHEDLWVKHDMLLLTNLFGLNMDSLADCNIWNQRARSYHKTVGRWLDRGLAHRDHKRKL